MCSPISLNFYNKKIKYNGWVGCNQWEITLNGNKKIKDIYVVLFCK